MDPLSLALNFIISYVAGCLPMIKFSQSLEDKIERCFKSAVDEWSVPQDVRKSVRGEMQKYLPELKEFVTNKSKGYNPKEYELLRLWAEKISADPECNQFITQNQNGIIQELVKKNLLRVEDVLKALKQQSEELSKVSKKINSLANRGVISCLRFWERWSTGPNGLELNPEIILSGRDAATNMVYDACDNVKLLYLESSSKIESMVFAAATILSRKNGDEKRTVIIEQEDIYNELVNEYTPFIVITKLRCNYNCALKNRHSVICCVSSGDKPPYEQTTKLPEISRDAFISSLEKSGIDSVKANKLAQDTMRDINVLWRKLGIDLNPPTWETPELIPVIIPALLAGSWDESNINDCERMEALSENEKSYSSFIEKLMLLTKYDAAPIEKIGSVWKVRSPYDLMSRLEPEISQTHINRLLECVEWLLEDDDPDVKAKMNEEELRFWKDKRTFSAQLKDGIYQGVTLLAVIRQKNVKSTRDIDMFIESKLKEFSIERYLSNSHNILWLAETAPSAFLKYIENDIEKGSFVLNELFQVKKRKYCIFGSQIYYTELLFALEGIAWDESYLPSVTRILLHLLHYPNDSNWANKPENSLYEIYRFVLPQTHCSFEYRIKTLRSLSEQYPKHIFQLCHRLLEGIGDTVFQPTYSFRWRSAERMSSSKDISRIPAKDVVAMTELMLEIIDWNEVSICNLLKLSSNRFMDCVREKFLDAVWNHVDVINGSETICDCLRDDIKRHENCKSAAWALSETELEPYKQLLANIEPNDIILKNKHKFDGLLLKDPELENLDRDYPKILKESCRIRAEILKNIIVERGYAGVWELSKCVKSPDCVADALIEMEGDNSIIEIYKLYVDGQLDEFFVRQSFLKLYYKEGEEYYDTLVTKLGLINEQYIAIVLYAPELNTHLMDMTETYPLTVKKLYWENVRVWHVPADRFVYSIEQLREVKRYKIILQLLNRADMMPLIDDRIKLDILFEMLGEANSILIQEIVEVANILKCIKMPNNEQTRIKLIQFELLLFNGLRPHLSRNEFHLLLLVDSDPEMLMQLVCLAYSPDEGFEEENLSEMNASEKNVRVTMAKLTWDFFFHYHDVPCTKIDGTIDEIALENYIINLQKLSILYHREHVMPLVIGQILGNLPEDNEYPSDFMCRMIEQLNDETVDTQINCAISNRRGMSTRAYNEGGTIERTHITTLKKYRENALFKSPRFVKIMDSEIRSYEAMAEAEDNNARLNELRS